MSVNSNTVIAQLIDSDLIKPVFLTGLWLPAVINLGFHVSHDICKFVKPVDESNVQVNLTSEHLFVNLHIDITMKSYLCDWMLIIKSDYGADEVSASIDDCWKIWLLYPPTDKNFKVIRLINSQWVKFARLMHQLEERIIVETTSVKAIHIPAACIHAMFTIQDDYLITENFTISKSLTAISSFIFNHLNDSLPIKACEICFDWFECCLDISLAHQQIMSVIHAWVKMEMQLISWASTYWRWQVSIQHLWKQYLQEDMPDDCLCDTQDLSTSLSKHFFLIHLYFLLSLSHLCQDQQQFWLRILVYRDLTTSIFLWE